MKWWSSWIAALMLGQVVGCQSAPSWTVWPPWGGPVSDHVPGVTPPAERIANIRAQGEKARHAGGADREAIARELAAMLRGEEDPMIRAELIRGLAPCQGPEVEQLLSAALKDPATEVRTTACEVWAERGGADAVRQLSEALGSDTDPDVRMAAARALGKTRDPAAVAALGRLLGDADPAMQYRAVESLRLVTGKDLGNDVGRWQQYVRGELPEAQQAPSLAERLRRWF